MSSLPFPAQPHAVGGARKSGRAVSSDRGDAVWEWQVATGVFERDVTEEQLRSLEAPDLQIVEFNPTDTGEQGRWIHDSHAFAVIPSRKSATPSPRTATRTGALRQLWARLRSAAD